MLAKNVNDQQVHKKEVFSISDLRGNGFLHCIFGRTCFGERWFHSMFQ